MAKTEREINDRRVIDYGRDAANMDRLHEAFLHAAEHEGYGRVLTDADRLSRERDRPDARPGDHLIRAVNQLRISLLSVG